MWIQLVQKIAAGRIITCAGCGDLLVVYGRADTKFHGKACRNALSNAKKKGEKHGSKTRKR